MLVHTEVRALLGDTSLEAVVVQDNESGEQCTLQARELFVFIGATPCTDWLVGTLALDSGGYILTGADAARVANGQFGELGRAPLMLETTEPGVFAVGDVRSGSIKRGRLRGRRRIHGRPAGP